MSGLFRFIFKKKFLYANNVDADQDFYVYLENIRIFNGFEVQIENSFTRVTVWHHKAFQEMLSICLHWQNF